MEDAQELYVLILQTANKFLRSAQLFEISVLKDFNPSFEELARIMRQVADVVYTLSHDDDPWLAQKAIEYVDIMHHMALAVIGEDELRLKELVRELDEKPFC